MLDEAVCSAPGAPTANSAGELKGAIAYLAHTDRSERVSLQRQNLKENADFVGGHRFEGAVAIPRGRQTGGGAQSEY